MRLLAPARRLEREALELRSEVPREEFLRSALFFWALFFCVPFFTALFSVVLSAVLPAAFQRSFSEDRTFAAWIAAAMLAMVGAVRGLAEEGRWDVEVSACFFVDFCSDISYPVYSPCPRWAWGVLCLSYLGLFAGTPRWAVAEYRPQESS